MMNERGEGRDEREREQVYGAHAHLVGAFADFVHRWLWSRASARVEQWTDVWFGLVG